MPTSARILDNWVNESCQALQTLECSIFLVSDRPKWGLKIWVGGSIRHSATHYASVSVLMVNVDIFNHNAQKLYHSCPLWAYDRSTAFAHVRLRKLCQVCNFVKSLVSYQCIYILTCILKAPQSINNPIYSFTVDGKPFLHINYILNLSWLLSIKKCKYKFSNFFVSS